MMDTQKRIGEGQAQIGPDDHRYQEISDATGFDYGATFQTEAQVRHYFTAAEQRGMVGDAAVQDQDVLDGWAEIVIRNRWHCEFLSDQGGQCVVVEIQPNGREIRRRADGKYETQPENDNYWIVVGTIEAARDAYRHPEKYRD